jgi:dihydrofolate synthase / folylpolyglutamate synthase
MHSEAEAWIASLSPWPQDGFGLDRMRALLAELGDPQDAYDAIHVVGTNGKSTATVTIESLLLAEGLRVGSTISPHVSGWAERIRVDGKPASFEAAIARARPAAERLEATQFETITAAALAEFAAAGVDAAVVEAGLGGRLDATNILRTKVVLLTNVGYDHTEVLGETLEQIAKEKLAVAHSESVVVLPDDTYSDLVAGRDTRFGGAREAAEAYVGHAIAAKVRVALPGRLEVRPGPPLEIRDGAHNIHGVRWLANRLRPLLADRGDCVLLISILTDRDAEQMLAELRPWASKVVTTASSNPRARRASELAATARALGAKHAFSEVVAVDDPRLALARARAMAGTEGAVLVTGSLYLLADLAAAEQEEA